jgi:hypothetical protein
MTLGNLMWIFMCPKLWIPCVSNTIPGKLSLIREKMSRRMCSCGCSHSQNGTRLHGLPVRGVVLFGGDTDRNLNVAKFSIPEPVLHQLFWKFWVYLYPTGNFHDCTWLGNDLPNSFRFNYRLIQHHTVSIVTVSSNNRLRRKWFNPLKPSG